MIEKKPYYNSIFKRTVKTLCLLVMVLCWLPQVSFAQSCDCTDCPDIATANTTTDFHFLIEGAANNDLSEPSQGVCGVVIEFIPDHIWSLEMTLTSPGGQQVTLIGPPVNQFGFTGPFAWEITFLPCGAAVSPDPGFNPVWHNDQPWALGALYSGSYYPFSGCLEDFDIGSVDGIWTLSVENNSPVNTAGIIDFSVVFCDEEGLDCFDCEAFAGTFEEDSMIYLCAGDPDMILDVEPLFGGNDPDTTVYGYSFIIAQQDTILAFDSLPDFTGFGSGVYQLYGFAFRLLDSLDIPPPDGNTTITSLNEDLINNSSFFCGDVTDDFVEVSIVLIDTTFLTDTLCFGESVIFGLDSIFIAADTIIENNDTTIIEADTIISAIDTLTESGIYTFNLESFHGCDSVVVFDLTIRDEISTVLFDTICAEDSYFFNGQFYETSGVYSAVFQAESLCDSTVTLNLHVRDSIITNLTAVICSGESYSVGNNTYTFTGISVDVLNSVENCDSTVILDLTVLDPAVSVVPPQALNCIDTTVILDGSGSTGEALTYEWLHLDNGNDGIVSGGDSPIAVVNKTGNYQLIVTDTLGGNECTATTFVGVGANVTPPHLIAFGGTLDCNETETELSAISITQGVIFNWTGPDSFTSSEQNPIVDIAGDFIVTATSPNGCESQFTVTVDIDTIPPALILSVSDTLDCNTGMVQLSANATPDAISFQWTGPIGFNSDLQNPQTDIPGNYILIAETPNGCTTQAEIEVPENFETPDASASGDTLTCAIQEIQLQGNSATPGVIYSWTGPNSFSSTEQNPVASEPGEYFLTVQAPNGCETTVPTIVEQDIAVPDAVADGGVLNCEVDTLQIFGNSITPGVTFSWNGPGGFVSSEQNPLVDLSGEYFLTVQAPNGCETTVSAMVEDDFEPPHIEASGDTLDCNDPLVQLFGNSNTQNVEYSWSGPQSFSSTEQNPFVDVPGNYELTVTGENGCTAQLAVEVEIDTLTPQVIVSVNDTLDCNTLIVQLSGDANPVATTYNWTGPGSYISNEQNPEASLPGDYFLTVTAPTGCTGQATLTVLQDTLAPDASATGDTLFCNISEVQLEGNSVTPGVSYSWTGPSSFNSTEQNPSVTEAGEYFLTVEAENGCQTTVSAMVEEDIQLPGAIAQGDTLNCNITEVQLQGDSPAQDVAFSWTGPGGYQSTEQNPVVDTAGVYWLTVTALNGCSSQASATVVIDTLPPQLLLSVNDTLDCNVLIVQISANATPQATTYEWTGPGIFSSDIQNPETDTPGDYFVTITAINGCTGQGSIEVIQDHEVPDALAIGDTLDCLSPEVQLTGYSETPGVSYSWIGPDSYTSTEQNPMVSVPGDYYLTVEGANGCGITQIATVGEDMETPDISALGDTLNCMAANGQLTGNSTTPDVMFQWTGPNSFASSEQNPLVTDPGEYFLTVTATNGCDTSVSVIVAPDLDAPDATAEGDTINCFDPSAQLEGFSSVSNVAYFWAGPNSFASSEQNPLVTDPGEYFLTVTAENGCETTTSAWVIEDIEFPDAAATGDTLDCLSPMVQIFGNSTMQGVTYHWVGPNFFVSDEQNPEVTVPGEYILTVTAANGCTAMDTTIVVQDANLPNVSALGDTLNCLVTTVQLSGNSSTPDVTYSWAGPDSFSSSEQNPDVSVPGIYILTVTSPNDCQAIASAIVVGDLEAPEIEIVGDTLDCAASSVQLGVIIATPGLDFNWTGPNSFTSSEQNPEVMEPGEYFLTVTAPNGCETSDSVIVVQDEDVPDIFATGDTLDCDATIGQLQGSSTFQGVVFNWTGPNSFASSEQNPQVTDPGEYILTVVAPNSCSNQTSVFLIQDDDAPDIMAMADTLSCINLTAQLQGFSNVPDVEYSWSGPNFSSSEQNPQVDEPGEYTLTITAPNGCVADTIIEVVDITTIIDAVANSSDTISCTSGSATISAQGSSWGSTIEYFWITENNDTLGNDPMQTVFAGGVYTLVVSDNFSGCTASTQVSIIDVSEEPVAEISTIGSQSITCANSNVLITGEGSGPLGEIDFEWLFEGIVISDEMELQVTEPGEYILQITNFTDECIAFDTIFINENVQLPEVEINAPDMLNCLNTLIQIDASGSSVGNEFIYQWTSASGTGIQSGATTLQPWINAPGTYTLNIENSENGCADSADVTILSDTQSPLAEAGIAEDLSCDNPVVFLNGIGSSDGVHIEYLWTGEGILGGETSLTPEVNQPGIYTLLVTNTENGCSATDSVSVEGTNDFVSNAAVEVFDPECFGESSGAILVENVSGGVAPYLYSIEEDVFVQNNFFDGLSEGAYHLTVMDAIGCEWDTLILLDAPDSIQVFLGADVQLELGDSFLLDPQITVPFSQMDTFIWQTYMPDFCDTCFSQWVRPLETTIFTITVFNEHGCRSTDEIVLRVENKRAVYIPNSFSPNGDGNNDLFVIHAGKEVLKINTFRIFSRWGAILFEKKNFQPNDLLTGWDGTHRGKPLNPDVFVYFAEIEFIDGRVKIFKGDITLLR